MPQITLPEDRDPRISDIFYFFEALTNLGNGRTVGRKIGVVQEILLRKYLESDPGLHRRMYLEQKLTGSSGAAHKVEFSWYAITDTAPAEAGSELVGAHGVLVTLVDEPSQRVLFTIDGKNAWIGVGEGTPRKGPLRDHLDQHDVDLRVWSDDVVLRIDVVDRSRLLASLESKRVGAQRFKGSDKLGAGIQTIEKAKQASLVAIDLDIQYNGSVKPLQDPAEQKQCISLVALGNGVHWTDKDRAVMGTYIDYAFLVKDPAIIRYSQYVHDLAGDGDDSLEFFMDYFKGMTIQEPDDFEVADDDFEVITPAEEDRTLREVLVEHIHAVDG